LYRMSLEYAWMMWDDEAESKINLRRWAAVLREFEKPLWADDVESIATREAAFREPTHAKHGSASLLSHAEVNDRIFAAGPGFIDAPYVWDVDGESNEAS